MAGDERCTFTWAHPYPKLGEYLHWYDAHCGWGAGGTCKCRQVQVLAWNLRASSAIIHLQMKRGIKESKQEAINHLSSSGKFERMPKPGGFIGPRSHAGY
jgi:hypothetical protein